MTPIKSWTGGVAPTPIDSWIDKGSCSENRGQLEPARSPEGFAMLYRCSIA